MEFKVIITGVTLMKMINGLIYPGSLTLLKIKVYKCKFFLNLLLVKQNVHTFLSKLHIAYAVWYLAPYLLAVSIFSAIV